MTLEKLPPGSYLVINGAICHAETGHPVSLVEEQQKIIIEVLEKYRDDEIARALNFRVSRD